MRKIHEHPLFVDHFREDATGHLFGSSFFRTSRWRLSNILRPGPGAAAAPAGGAAAPGMHPWNPRGIRETVGTPPIDPFCVAWKDPGDKNCWGVWNSEEL